MHCINIRRRQVYAVDQWIEPRNRIFQVYRDPLIHHVRSKVAVVNEVPVLTASSEGVVPFGFPVLDCDHLAVVGQEVGDAEEACSEVLARCAKGNLVDIT